MKTIYSILSFACGLLLGVSLFSHRGSTRDNFTYELDSLRTAANILDIQKQAAEERAIIRQKQKAIFEAKAYNQEQRAIKAEQRAKIYEAKFRNMPKPVNAQDSAWYYPLAVVNCDSALVAADTVIVQNKKTIVDLKDALKEANEALADKSEALVKSKLETWKLQKMDTIHIKREAFLERKANKNLIKGGLGGVALGIILTLLL